jgi:hypothetical protein
LESDPSIYYHSGKGIIIAVFVDDILILGKTIEACNTEYNLLAVHFTMVNRGSPTTYLGININRPNPNLISIDQSGYIDRMLARFRMLDCRPESTPTNYALTLHKRLDHEAAADTKLYNQITGSVNHLAVYTRPDISFTVSQLCQYNSNPSVIHMNAALHLLRYLKGTKHFKISYGGGHLNPLGFPDADFANRIEDRKSVTGYVWFMNNGMIMWISHTQNTVALSTKDAEYIALSECSREAIARSQFLKELQISHEIPALLCDNTSAITIARNPVHHHRTKHIDIKYHYVRHVLQEGQITIDHIESEHQPADILTKKLNSVKHRKALRIMGFLWNNHQSESPEEVF